MSTAIVPDPHREVSCAICRRAIHERSDRAQARIGVVCWPCYHSRVETEIHGDSRVYRRALVAAVAAR